MRIKYRLYGMILCLIVITISLIMWTYTNLQITALLLAMAAAGYALRETLDIPTNEKKKEPETK